MCRPAVSNTYTYSECNTYSYAHTYGDSNPYGHSYSDSDFNSNGYAYSDTNSDSNSNTYTMSGRRTDNRLFYVCVFKHRDRCHRWRIWSSEWICHRMDDSGGLYR